MRGLCRWQPLRVLVVTGSYVSEFRVPFLYLMGEAFQTWLDSFQPMHSLGSPRLIFRAFLFRVDLGTGVPACQEQLCVTGEIFISCQFNNRSRAHSQNWLLNLAGVLTARSWKMRLSTWKGPRQKPRHPKNVLRSSGTVRRNQRFVSTRQGKSRVQLNRQQ